MIREEYVTELPGQTLSELSIGVSTASSAPQVRITPDQLRGRRVAALAARRPRQLLHPIVRQRLLPTWLARLPVSERGNPS